MRTAEVVSRATHLTNILNESRKVSSFELARGYTPSILGLSQTLLSEHILSSHQEQLARRSLQALKYSRSPNTVGKDALTKDTPIYFFRRSPEFGTCQKGSVCKAELHSVLLFTKQDHSGKAVRAAYEDVRLTPKTPRLQKLDRIDFIFQRSSGITDGDYSLKCQNTVEHLPPPAPQTASKNREIGEKSLPTTALIWSD